MANHTNQVVLITGGASGIGKATAMKLAAKGVTVVITGRREATGAAAVKEIERVARDGAQVRFIRNDVTDESAVKGLIDGIVSELSTRPPRDSPRLGGKEITMPTHADDELEIMRLLARLAQAVDDRDADAYSDCLADEVVCLVSDASPNEVLEFGKFATEWRITKRHMRTRYTIGDPAQKAIVGRIS